MDHQPYFSIIIPTYGRPAPLGACLEALARLTYPRQSFEVIVVDDGSPTSPAEVVAVMRDQLDIRLLTQPHAGPAAARNLGAAHARGTFLVFTDDDCEPAPDWLEALAARFARQPGRVIGGRTKNALPDNLCAAASQLLLDYLYWYYNGDHDRARFFASLNLAVPVPAFRALGGFNVLFTAAAAEDREFCDRWLQAGYQMSYAPEVLVRHAHHLTLGGFWRQHFGYGRGAFGFHRARASRGLGGLWVEPPRFYLNLLRCPFSQAKGTRALRLGGLLVLSQVANLAGFLWEVATHRRSHHHLESAK